MLGIRPTLDGLVIRPCLPDAWDRVSCRCRVRGYRLTIDITHTPSGDSSRNGITVNGAPVPGMRIPDSALRTGKANPIEVRC